MEKPYNRFIKFRLNDNDKSRLAKYCRQNDITSSEFFRYSIAFFSCTDNKDKIFKRDIKFKRELLYEINRYGNNLNQIAYNLNRLFKANITSLQAQAIDESLLKLSKIEKELRHIKKIVSERL